MLKVQIAAFGISEKEAGRFLFCTGLMFLLLCHDFECRHDSFHLSQLENAFDNISHKIFVSVNVNVFPQEGRVNERISCVQNILLQHQLGECFVLKIY